MPARHRPAFIYRLQNRLHKPHSRSKAFTLIELLVVIAVIALLIGLLLPSLGAARESGRIVKCQANLRSLAQAANSYSNFNKGFFSSGSWDNSLEEGYGPMDTTGWVADMVLGDYALPGKMLCPSSPAQASQNLSPSRLNNASHRVFTQAQVDEMIDRGMNTNYAQTWHMAHTDVKVHQQAGNPDFGRFKDRRYLRGPLNEKNTANAPNDQIAFFGDGHVQLGEDDADIVFYRNQRIAGAKALTDGPVAMNRPPGINGLGVGRQRFEDLGPTHGKGGKVVDGAVEHDKNIGNIAFADGHVGQFRDDTVRDGRWGGGGESWNGTSVLRYHEIEGKVFGGWLTRAGFW